MCTEIPDISEDHDLCELVTKHQMHGPSFIAKDPNVPCLQNGNRI